MFSMQSQAPNKVAECQSEVSQYLSAVQEDQKQARENAEAAAAETQARTQANQTALQHAKDLQIEKNANNQSYEQSSAVLRAKAEQRTAQLKQALRDAQAADPTPTAMEPGTPADATSSDPTAQPSSAPVQASEGNAQAATDAPPRGTQSSDSQPAGVDPTAVLLQQIEGGSVPAQSEPNASAGPQPSPSPNTAIDTLQKDVLDYSPPNLQQYIAANLSLENAQKAVEFNGPTSESARALSDLEQLASSPNQEFKVPGSFNQDFYQTEANDRATLDKLLVEKGADLFLQYVVGLEGAALWATTTAGKATVNDVWDALCINPKNAYYCATTPPNPQPGPVPASPGGANQQSPSAAPTQRQGPLLP
jgi:hypothetical protein